MAHLKRHKKKRGTYYVIHHPGQKPLAVGYVTEAEAQTLLERYKAKITLGLLPPPRTSAGSSKTPAPRVPTLREWWGPEPRRDQSWTPCKMLSYFTAGGKKGNSLRPCNDSRKTIIKHIGDLRLDEVTVEAADRFVEAMRAAGLGDRTCQMRINHLQESLNVAAEYGVLNKEEVPKLRRPVVKTKKVTAWHTPDQARRLVAEVQQRKRDGEIDTITELAILTSVCLGLRKGELLSRRWPHIDLQRLTINICPVLKPDGTWWTPKTQKGHRRVALPPALAALFREEWMRQGRGEGWIFPSPVDLSKPRSDFRRALKTTCKRAGVPMLTPHGLRHTAATSAAYNGAKTKDLMDIFGWASAAMPTQVYAHTMEERTRALVVASSPLEEGPEVTSRGNQDAEPARQGGAQ